MKIFCLTLASTVTLAANAVANNQCADVLANGVFNKFEESGSYEYAYAIKDAICSSSNGSDSSSGEAKVKFGLDIINTISGSLGGGRNHTGESSFAREHCRDSAGSNQNNSWYNSLTLVADQNILNSWEACVRSNPNDRGLYCYANKQQNFLNQIHYTIVNNDPYYELNRVRMNGVNLRFLTDTTSTLGYGSYELTAGIINKNMQSVFSINAQKRVSGHLNQVSCNVITAPQSDIMQLDSGDTGYIKTLLQSGLNNVTIKAYDISLERSVDGHFSFGRGVVGTYNKASKELSITIKGTFRLSNLNVKGDMLLLLSGDISSLGGTINVGKTLTINDIPKSVIDAEFR